MLGSGFSNAPVSRFLLFGLITTSILASITDSKLYFYIEVVPHLYPYQQIWRILTWQTAYTSSTELLFAAMTIYHMRLIERLWGSRKFASYILQIYTITSILTPLILATILRPLSLGTINYLPAGATAITFSLLSQYHAAIPQVYKYRIASSISDVRSNTSTSTNTSDANAPRDRDPAGLILSDKSLTYLLAGQLALSQLPGSLLAATVGWIVGLAWRYEILLPARLIEWRVPAWVVGEKTRSGGEGAAAVRGGGVEELRRRLDERGVRGLSSAVNEDAGSDTRRRT